MRSPSGTSRSRATPRRFAWCLTALTGLNACSGENQSSADVPFDRLEVVIRMDLEADEAAGGFVSTDASSSWVEAFADPDRGWGIFRADGHLRLRVPEDDSGELRIDDVALRLLSDDYTRSGWLEGARLDFRGEGRAAFLDRYDENQSTWRLTEMPGLVLTDISGSIRGEFAWLDDAPTPELEPTLSLSTGGTFPSVLFFFLRYTKLDTEGEP